ncbi:MAG TPA: hypothetical protein ENG33_01050, partial [Chloroflexi bacterium]|nr:hypothetical protein [Chloroflexota bacterium]
MKPWSIAKILSLLVLVLLITTACLPTKTPSKPVVIITSPAPGTQVQVGQVITIQATATDKKGVARIELWVDGALAGTASAPGGQALQSFLASFNWTPPSPGSHTIEVKAYNVDGNVSSPAAIILNVTGAVAQATPTPTGPTQPPLQPTTPPPTLGPQLAYLVANTNVNIRSGPGTGYPVLAVLGMGQRAVITGRSADGGWWQIEHPPGSGGRGWV